jgi:hypothetical protein
MAITIASAVQTSMINAAANAWADSIDGGAGAGQIVLFLADGVTEVATCVGQDPFFGAAVAGVATQSGNAVDTAATGNVGAVTLFEAQTSDGTVVWDGTVAESGADLNIDDGTPGGGVIIDTNAVVTLSNITLTVTLS